MIDFYECFGNDANEDREIPQEIIEELNKELPSNLIYFYEDGQYYVGPKSDEKEVTFKFDIDPENNGPIIKKLDLLPKERWGEYIYRSQSCITIKNTKIGDSMKLVPIEQTMGYPLSDEPITITKSMIFPGKLSDPKALLFETEEGEKVIIQIQQQAYDSISEIKYSNIDFPGLTINMYLYSPLADVVEETAKTSKENPSCINISVTPAKAKSTSDALTSLHIFKGLLSGKTKVNGSYLQLNFPKKNYDPQIAEDALSFWTAAKKIEEKLGIHFVPSAAFTSEDARLFSELNSCLNEKKKIVWKHPFDHFRVSGFHPQKVDKNKDEQLLEYKFLEGPIPCSLFGAEFEIYSLSEMSDLVMTNIIWEDEQQGNGEIYVADAPGKTWILKRLYIPSPKDDNCD